LDGELTPSKRKRLSELEKQQEIYTRDMEVEIFEKKNSGPNINKMRYTTLRMTRNTRVSVDKKQTRNVRHNRALGKNRGICKDFFLAMRPITCEEWRKAYVVERAIMLIQIPGVMLCSIYIPLVDYEMEKHGWNKLLNCIQVMLNPAMSIIVIKGETVRLDFPRTIAPTIFPHSNSLDKLQGQLFVVRRHKPGIHLRSLLPSHNHAHSRFYVLPIPNRCATILPFGETWVRDIIGVIESPSSHSQVFTVMNLTGSMLMIFFCATEIDKVLEVIGHILEVEEDFMGATVKACTGSLGPLIANIAMAMHGYPKMAYASAIGGPFFSEYP